MTLPEFWFLLIGFMFASYFVLEGFDFGVGALLPVLGKDDTGRRVMINTIGPVWDANETWLVLAAGAMFAAFPSWYATTFSAYYLPLLVILGALIVRGLAFEFRGKQDDEQWRRRWDRCIVLGSTVVPLLWGAFFANLVRGLPIDARGDYAGGILDLFSPYAMLGGLVVLSMFVTHGAIFLTLKTSGGIRHDASELGDPTRRRHSDTLGGVPELDHRLGRRCAVGDTRDRGRRRLDWRSGGERARPRRHRFLPHDQRYRPAGHDLLCAAVPERDAVDNRPRQQPHDCKRKFVVVHADADELGRRSRRSVRPGVPGVELLGVPQAVESRPYSTDPAARRRRGRQPIDIMRAIDPRLLRRARSSSGFLLVCVVIGLAIAACVFGQAVTLAMGISRVFLGGADFHGISILLVLLAGLTLMRAALSYLQETAAARATAVVKSQLRQGLMCRVVDAGPSWSSEHRTGEITQLATRGLEALDAYFSRYLPQLVLTAIISPLFVVVVWATDWISGVVLLLTLPIVLLFMVLAGLSAQRRTNDRWRALERMSNHFLDVAEGLTTLRVFGRARAQRRAVQSVTHEYRRTTMTVLRVSFLSSFVLELFASLSVAIVAVQVGLRLIGGSIELEAALIVLLLAPEAFQPLRTLGASYHAAAEGRSATEKILDILDEPAPPLGTRITPSAVEFVAVQDVTVHRADASIATFAPTSFGLRRSEVVALVGPSGCGKSTLLSVMLGFLEPFAGTVRMDGVSVAEADRQSWLGHIAWMPQRPTLVAGTVAGNVRLGAPDATDTEVAAALAKAACDGLDPRRRIAQNGADLSAGERQRIALARCFLRTERGADLLLLDEPTAHLDAPTELHALAAIRQLSVGRFVLMVAHRPVCDRFRRSDRRAWRRHP